MTDYAKALGARLRAIRQQQGLSLHGVEEKSDNRWKAVVVGSYERGDRAVTVQKLAELADFYGSLVESEGNHYATYLIMARHIDEPEADRRLDFFLDLDAELIRKPHPLPMLH